MHIYLKFGMQNGNFICTDFIDSTIMSAKGFLCSSLFSFVLNALHLLLCVKLAWHLLSFKQRSGNGKITAMIFTHVSICFH